MPAYHPNVPKQTNGTDCGLFLLENVEGFLTRPDFILQDLNGKKGYLFNKRIVDEKREILKRVVIAMSEQTKTQEQLGKSYQEWRATLEAKTTYVLKTNPTDNNNWL